MAIELNSHIQNNNLATRDLLTPAKQTPYNAPDDDIALLTPADERHVELTPKAKQYQQLESDIRNAPDVDEAKVAAIKAQLAEGRYAIDSSRLAKNIIDFEETLF